MAIGTQHHDMNPFILRGGMKELPGNQEHEKEAVAEQANAQAIQQCPNPWSSAPQCLGMN